MSMEPNNVPTFNKYKNDPGYFIRAWTPETGNINYKIRREGNPIVEEFGLEHGDDISWDTINSLKSLGLVYTDESGTIRVDEFEPDPDHVSETSLTQEEATELLSIVQEHYDLSTEELEELSEILGVDAPTSAFHQVETSFEAQVENMAEGVVLPTENSLGKIISCNVSIKDIRGEVDNGRASVEIDLFGQGPDDDDLRVVTHWVFICQEHGLEHWEIAYNEVLDRDQTGELIQQQGLLLPVVADTLANSELGQTNLIGPPRSTFVSHDEIGLEDSEWPMNIFEK